MLGLRERVQGDLAGVGVGVGHDDELGWPGESVDADGAVELAFRLRDPGVARSGDHVDTGDRGGPDRQGGNGLGAAKRVDLVRPGQVSRGEHGRGQGAVRARRRDKDRPPHPGYVCGDQAHQDR